MERNEIENKVTDILVEKLAVEPNEVTMKAKLEEDLLADSLDILEIVLEAEKVFTIDIKDEDATDIKTVKDIVDLIEKKTNKEA